MSDVGKIIEQGMLYDFYGDLLTAHQKEIYEDLVYNDMSLNEIAQEYGISKQGVHDLIKRCTQTMQGYEDKLHMIARFNSIRADAQKMKNIIDNAAEDFPDRNEIRRLSDHIIEELI
ncbi:YlxM family DNA-binding protein [Butyrivibrio sp. TB]|uniref:YlxM family DNA-binding protein n=1 Tax=Butyrivibrio sp. TB TaxID=1520809 RepID=UPI0008C7AD04|nr:DNA-binding protein [Butyrivibrio sp. TB]SEP55018.1 hypothetical protein SAMN02910382_00139 [Butyrivibrio sp. TB]